MYLKLFIIWVILHVQVYLVINAKNLKGPPIIKEHPKSIVARRNYPVTLKCVVSGSQEIRWFRDGQRISSRQNARSHRMVLTDGSLFFLRVTNNKRDGDAGIYWCVAVNRRGKSRSHNATLSVAFLDEFPRQEETVDAMLGGKAVLKCRPPNGLPKPRIRWKLRNSVVEYDTRRYPNSNGDLIFNDVAASDGGEYFCEASNLSGTEKSSGTQLDVKEPYRQPFMKSQTAGIQEDVILPCSSYGKNVTNVTWKKRGGKIPIDRSQIVNKHALQISTLTFSDSGEYFCESVGTIGTYMSAIVLKVFEKSEILYISPNQLVSAGTSFNLSCNITGTPEPFLIWKVPSDKGAFTYLLSGESNGAVYSTNSPHLVVKNAHGSNSGIYTCWGINFSSGVSATSRVNVLDTFPPPLMGIKPQDLGRREGTTATFACEAASEFLPANITWWYRKDMDTRDVKIQSSKFISILPIGALVIRNVSTADAGIYTCEVASEAGSVKEEALLIIDNVAIAFHPTRHVPRPAPPSKPVATTVTDSFVHLSWKPNSKRSRQDDVTYSIEMWTSPWPKWESVMTGITEESSHITGLSPEQPYLFVIKAINKHGSESFPSPWSDVISTSAGEDVDLYEKKHIYRRLSKVHVTILGANIISPGTIDLSWKVDLEMEKIIDTFAIYSINDSIISRLVVFGSPSGYRLTDMRSNSNLTIFVTPIYGSQEGTPSNSIVVETGYTNDFQLTPRNIKANDFASGFIITWEDPNPVRAEIIGYRVLVMSNGTTSYYTTNETSIKFNPITSKFSVKVAVVTVAGPGPWSESKNFHDESCCDDGEPMSSVLYSPFHPAWFLCLLIPTGIFVSLLSMLYLRYVRQKNPPCVVQLSSPVYYSGSTSFNERDNTNIFDKKAWKPQLRSVQILKPSPIVAEYAEPRSRYDDTEPYATTALLTPSFNPITSYQNRRDISPEKNVQVNWSNILPPPPEESPPAELQNLHVFEEVGECDQCGHQDSHVYAHPFNVVSPTQSHYIVPHSQFTRFTSLQVPNKKDTFLLEAKSSTH